MHAVLLLYINVKHSEKTFEAVLTVKAGIYQIAFFVLPFGKTAVVKRLFSILNDERHDVIMQTFLQGNQTPDSAVAVLKRMDAFKVVMEGNNILDGFGMISRQQRFHTRRYILRLDGFQTTDRIGSLLIITHRKP